MAPERRHSLSEAYQQEQARLLNFIQQRVPNLGDAEDILQDVFYRLVEANRLLMPIESLTGWLYQVARNRIIDLYRKQRPETFSDEARSAEGDEERLLDELLPSTEEGPAAAYARQSLMDELAQALGELTADQRDVFVAHELDGRSFKEISAASGENINTLLSRKRYAVLALREKLHHTYQDYLEG
jgi:RNA polymerase sigma factor (sigma-70 family)